MSNIKMNEQEEYAVLSKAAYDWYHGEHDLAKEELQAYGLPYRFDTEHSDANSVTIVKPDGSAVVSYGISRNGDVKPE